ncbi:hypothetical protein ABEB36_014173 [Hypothenemus hampei]|uniref:Uncharacterized protein n=1 Tax=Hypothenemus hampei TaxID=57062 RepID=A0ABD1E3U5_HYPHA
MNNSLERQSSAPSDLKIVVTEVLQSEEFLNQLKCSIERASSNRSLNAPVQQMRQQITAVTPACELRRLFPSIRSSSNNEARSFPMRTSLRNITERTKSRKGNNKMVSLDFKKYVILVKTQDHTTTLTGLEKSSAYANGYAISEATFNTTWTETDIFEYIKNLFKDKFHETKFEILILFSRSLVKPSLPDGTAFDGSVMRRLFAQKVV